MTISEQQFLPLSYQLPPRVRPGEDAAPTDAELLAHFAASRDEEAFTELVARHGPLVLHGLGVLRLGDQHLVGGGVLVLLQPELDLVGTADEVAVFRRQRLVDGAVVTAEVGDAQPAAGDAGTFRNGDRSRRPSTVDRAARRSLRSAPPRPSPDRGWDRPTREREPRKNKSPARPQPQQNYAMPCARFPP